MRRLSALLLAGILLMGGCSSEETTTEEKPKQNTSVEKVAEKEEKVDQQELINQYVNYHMPYMEELQEEMTEMQNLMIFISQHPDAEWGEDLGKLLGRMLNTIQHLKSYSGEIPEGLELSHEYLLKAMDEYEYMCENMPTAMALLFLGDDSEMTKVKNSITTGSDYLGKATQEIIKFTEQNKISN